jgi:hypothetical protein
MDATETGVIAIVGLIVSIGGSLLAIVNHRRVRSNCCGLPLVMSVDVETTTPPTDLRIKIPQAKQESEPPKLADPPVLQV